MVDALSRVQPAKVAVPAIAALARPPVQVIVDPAASAETEMVTVFVATATVLPPASSTSTAGWPFHAAPAVPPPGCVPNASLAGTPTVTAKAALVPTPTPEPVALSVYPAADRSIRQPV